MTTNKKALNYWRNKPNPKRCFGFDPASDEDRWLVQTPIKHALSKAQRVWAEKIKFGNK